MLGPNVPVMVNEPYKPSYVMYFGWVFNGLNGF